MGRDIKCRRVTAAPKVPEFKPVGVPLANLEETLVKIEELEAIRLKDLLGLEQEDCVDSMRVSRPTFQRILREGRRKVAESKIGICADAGTPEAVVDGRFGRCAYFLLWDEAQHKLESLMNDRPGRKLGAGTGAVQELLSRGVGILICNRIGPNALTVLQKAGGKVFMADRGLSLDLVLDKYAAGELRPISNPTQTGRN